MLRHLARERSKQINHPRRFHPQWNMPDTDRQVGCGPRNGFVWLSIFRRSGPIPVNLISTLGRAIRKAFARNSEWVCFVVDETRMHPLPRVLPAKPPGMERGCRSGEWFECGAGIGCPRSRRNHPVIARRNRRIAGVQGAVPVAGLSGPGLQKCAGSCRRAGTRTAATDP